MSANLEGITPVIELSAIHGTMALIRLVPSVLLDFVEFNIGIKILPRSSFRPYRNLLLTPRRVRVRGTERQEAGYTAER